MSIVDQLNMDGKEIEVNGKKINNDSKIMFNMKAFISLIIIIGSMFASTYYLIDGRIDDLEQTHKQEYQALTNQINQLKDEKVDILSTQINETNGKMEMLMMLINSNQVDLTPTPNQHPEAVAPVPVSDTTGTSLPSLENLNSNQ